MNYNLNAQTDIHQRNAKLRFVISFEESENSDTLDGRMLLMISADSTNEPRFQINDNENTQLIYGINVEKIKPGEKVFIDASVFGYPLKSIAEIPAGYYWMQGLLNKYETFNLSDGRVLNLPPDKGEGQHWNKKPGNLYSAPKKVYIDPSADQIINVLLDKEIPPINKPVDTKYLKYVKIKSKMLSEWWGRPMYIGAKVLLPWGFEDHLEAKYPIVIFHGHFSAKFFGWRETPPNLKLNPEYSERFDLPAYNKTIEEYSYKFYQDWISDDFPRMIIIEIQHANPYYDDSYAVNSANLGPYGDAINYELIPYIEEKFRGIGEGWARFLYGGSTGGWEAIATQIFYPDMYNGCYASCPDPIDFRAYTSVNIYENENAYYINSKWKKTPVPGTRNYLGKVKTTMEEINHLELVLGTNGRSGQQWDIWEAVYSPVGDDGYPARIWNKMTGEIDISIAEYWKENYDLRYILERDWKTLGPKLIGKINLFVGEMDNYYLNNSVYLMEDFLESTTDPYYDGEIDYEPRAEHCWNGDHTRPNALSRLRYNQMYMPRILKRILETAPEGADLESWRY
ncbi:MAG: hypothetical protein IH950_12655 [Bacteroidetes bacterium]|nr:hypothetical protein [Bacteroidota bacterium]